MPHGRATWEPCDVWVAGLPLSDPQAASPGTSGPRALCSPEWVAAVPGPVAGAGADVGSSLLWGLVGREAQRRGGSVARGRSTCPAERGDRR